MTSEDRDITARFWSAFLLAAAVVMFGAALARVPSELWRLAAEPVGHGAAGDLRFRFIEVREWFSGRPVYGIIESADYPPASYLILIPLVGWPTLEMARVVASLSMVAALAWLTRATVRVTGSDDRRVRWFAVWLPLAMYATAASIRVGQIGVYLIVLLMAGILLLDRVRRTWKTDIAASALLVLALVKPTFSVPFMWIAFFRGGIRPALLISGGYVVLTLIAASFQDASLPVLVQGWLGQSAFFEFNPGHANLYTWLDAIGLERFVLPGSLILLFLFGFWTWWHRRSDLWLLLGSAAIVSRIWTFHRWYDDILMLFPMISLLRVIGTGSSAGRLERLAMVLIALICAFGIAPYVVRAAPPPWGDLFKVAKASVWLATLGFLLIRARKVAVRSL